MSDTLQPVRAWAIEYKVEDEWYRDGGMSYNAELAELHRENLTQRWKGVPVRVVPVTIVPGHGKVREMWVSPGDTEPHDYPVTDRDRRVLVIDMEDQP